VLQACRRYTYSLLCRLNDALGKHFLNLMGQECWRTHLGHNSGLVSVTVQQALKGGPGDAKLPRCIIYTHAILSDCVYGTQASFRLDQFEGRRSFLLVRQPFSEGGGTEKMWGIEWLKKKIHPRARRGPS